MILLAIPFLALLVDLVLWPFLGGFWLIDWNWWRVLLAIVMGLLARPE